jgi:hypothetical protein
VEVLLAPALRAACSAEFPAAGATPSVLIPLLFEDPVASDGAWFVVGFVLVAAPALRSAWAAFGFV